MKWPVRCYVCNSDNITQEDERGPITHSITSPYITSDGMSTKTVAHAYKCHDCGAWTEIVVHHLAITVGE